MEKEFSRRALIVGCSVVATAAQFPTDPAEALDLNLKFDGAATIGLDAATITWGSLGFAVATNVIGALGARAFGAALGGNNSVDIDGLAREFARQVDGIVRRAIADNEREKLFSTAKSLHRLFLDYYNAPRDQLLGDLHRETVIGVGQAVRLRLDGIASYAICGSLMLSVYQEQYLQSQNEGDRLNLVEGVDSLVKDVPVFTSALMEATQARFSPIRTVTGMVPPPPQFDFGVDCYFADGELQPCSTRVRTQLVHHETAAANRIADRKMSAR
ncbi:hypothetical protein JQ554_32750, partial [Bradyrhizobium diazoefficiens]